MSRETTAAVAARRPPVIGLVGGIGAGKSTVAAELAQLGCAVIDADKLGHELLRRPDARDRVAAEFGAGVIAPDGSVDRRALGRRVFRDDGSREDYDRLMAIAGPALREEIDRRLAALLSSPEGRAGVVLDAALLYEYGLDSRCDAVICVVADRAVREARVAANRGWPPGEITRREAYQKSSDFKVEMADHTVDNSGSAEYTAQQVRDLYPKILGRE
jgi:dephospho-CoA kinase